MPPETATNSDSVPLTPIGCGAALDFFEVTPQRDIKAATAHILTSLHQLFQEKPNIEDHEGTHLLDIPGTNLKMKIKGPLRLTANSDRVDEKALGMFLIEKGTQFPRHCLFREDDTSVVSKRKYIFLPHSVNTYCITSNLATRPERYGKGYGAALGYTTNYVAQMMHKAWAQGKETKYELSDNSLYNGERGWSSTLAQELGMGAPVGYEKGYILDAPEGQDNTVQIPIYRRVFPSRTANQK